MERTISMAGKARVHELAKELGVRSNEILARLAEQGAFVKSASSTVEGPVARRLRESYGVTKSVAKESDAKAKREALADGIKQPSKSSADKPAPRRPPRQRANSADIAERYWRASTSENPKRAINRLFGECKAVYGLSRSEVLKMFTDEQRRNPIKYVKSGKSRNAQSTTSVARSPRPVVKSPAGTTNNPAENSPDVIAHPRVRSTGLPPAVAQTNLEALGDIVMRAAGSLNERSEILACLDDLAPNTVGGYGYLGWRYSAIRSARHGGGISPTAQQDLAVLAEIIGNERQLLESLIHTYGSILENQGLAIRAIEGEFRRLHRRRRHRPFR